MSSVICSVSLSQAVSHPRRWTKESTLGMHLAYAHTRHTHLFTCNRVMGLNRMQHPLCSKKTITATLRIGRWWWWRAIGKWTTRVRQWGVAAGHTHTGAGWQITAIFSLCPHSPYTELYQCLVLSHTLHTVAVALARCHFVVAKWQCGIFPYTAWSSSAQCWTRTQCYFAALPRLRFNLHAPHIVYRTTHTPTDTKMN